MVALVITVIALSGTLASSLATLTVLHRRERARIRAALDAASAHYDGTRIPLGGDPEMEKIRRWDLPR